MDSWQYLLVLGLCVAVTLPLEIIGGARVYRRPGALLATLVPVMAVFAGWDLIAVRRGDWWFSARYILGPRVAALPVEEWLFFLVVPVCALLTYQVLGHRAHGLRSPGGKRARR
jgi:lycopene cyclase domain-containing protein